MKQRIIKFRSWDTKPLEGKSKMIYGIDKIKEFYDGIELIDELLNGVAPEVKIMQFTGLKDKNGKEIYEGDIINWFADGIEKTAIVIWRSCGWCAERFDKDLNVFERYYQFSNFIPVEINREGKEDMFDGEVIGNIYENPELLKGVKE